MSYYIPKEDTWVLHVLVGDKGARVIIIWLSNYLSHLSSYPSKPPQYPQFHDLTTELIGFLLLLHGKSIRDKGKAKKAPETETDSIKCIKSPCLYTSRSSNPSSRKSSNPKSHLSARVLITGEEYFWCQEMVDHSQTNWSVLLKK